MKKSSLLFAAMVLLLACNNETKVDSATTDSTVAVTEPVSLPYTVEKTPDWEKGSDENLSIAMKALKAYETNDSTAMKALLADSVSFYYDGGEFKGTADSFMTMLNRHRNTLTNVSIKMNDYESVKSKNRGEEWVGLWYVETTTEKSGKTDSLTTMDDIMIVNGKIRVIDSKVRHFAKQ